MPKTASYEKRDNTVTAEVLKYLRKNADIVCHIQDIVKETGKIPGSVDSALQRMVARPDFHVYRVEKGMYIYRTVGDPPVLPPAPRPKVEEINAVSAYPKVDMNSAYGKETKELAESLATKGYAVRAIDRKPALYEFVGHVNDMYELVRDERDDLFVAIPLDDYAKGTISR